MKDFKRLFSLLKPYRLRMLLFFIFATLMVFFNALSFVMSGPFFQILFEPEKIQIEAPAAVNDLKTLIQSSQYELSVYIEQNGQEKALMFICLFIIAVFFFKNVFRYLSVFTIIPVRYGVAKSLRNRLFDKILDLPLRFFADERKGDLIIKMTNDVEEFRLSSLKMIESLLRDPFAIILSFGVMISISLKLTLIAIVMIIFIVLVIARVSSKLKQKSTKAQDKMADMTSTVEETLGGLRIIKGFNALNYQRNKFNTENETHQNMLTRISWRIDTASPLSEFMGASAVVGLLLIGGSLAVRGEFIPGALISFIALFWSMITPLKSLSNAFFNLKKGFGAADRIYSLLETPSSIQDAENAQSIKNIHKNIEYRNVDFSYENDRQILNNVSFNLPKGKILALVGASGAGKSTLVDLLPRFYDIESGEILLDGINIKALKMSDLRELMGIVSQEPVLFNDTILNNISFGLENISEAQVIEAAKIANAHDFILEAEQGYQTIIGDRGVKLSGGQRQRLTIARAILRNPPILILDEATSSLDSKSEKLVQDALFKLMKNRTSIVIAHRLSTIQHADEILVMNEGRVIEQGNHETLLKKGGMYKKLVELQTI
ncbi:MAG: ABC transporter ATP-binding protein [Saprospiraceae bacterium]